MERFDVVIIGGGPGGTSAAKRAAQLGAKAALIEQRALGGVCLNWGCIPTKYLLRNSRSKVDKERLEQIVGDKDRIVTQLGHSLTEELRGAGIKVFRGSGEVRRQPAGSDGAWKILIKKGPEVDEIEAGRIVLASGSRPVRIASLAFNGQNIISAEEALSPRTIPENLLVIGGGAVGVELATMYNGWGSWTALLEMQPGILPSLDRSISSRLETLLRRQNVNLLLGQKVLSGQEKSGLVEVVLEGGEKKKYDQVIVAVGRELDTAQYAGLGLAIENGRIKTDEYLQTNLPGIYATGDVTGIALLAHCASYQGLIAGENAAGGKTSADYSAIPFCVYSHPEAGGVGLTEEQARQKNIDIKSIQVPYRLLGKAVADGTTDGMLKLIAEKAGDRIIGLHILGQNAEDLLGEAALIIKQKLTLTELRQIIHPHPSYSEIFWEAALRLT